MQHQATHSLARAVLTLRRIAWSGLAALALALPVAISAPIDTSEAAASKHVSRCANRIVAACKQGKHLVCSRRNAEGCCVNWRCELN